MDDSASGYALTDEERKRFTSDGYVLLEQALADDEVDRFTALADRYDAEFRADPDVDQYYPLNLHDLVGREPEFLDLVDWPTTFPKIVGALGWNIQLFHTQLVVTPPMPKEAPPGGYAYHQDNNRMNRDFETPAPHPRVSAKLGYFLTDLPEPGMGNLCVVPGSHQTLELERDDDGQPVGAIEVTARAGDVILFDRRIWHSASTNLSDVPRKVLFYGYSYRWLRPKSAMDYDEEHLLSLDPIRRQLLGWATSQNGYFDPQEDDVPLRGWIEEHLGPDAVAD